MLYAYRLLQAVSSITRRHGVQNSALANVDMNLLNKHVVQPVLPGSMSMTPPEEVLDLVDGGTEDTLSAQARTDDLHCLLFAFIPIHLYNSL